VNQNQDFVRNHNYLLVDAVGVLARCDEGAVKNLMVALFSREEAVRQHDPDHLQTALVLPGCSF
jgi:hypothetical protein